MLPQRYTHQPDPSFQEYTPPLSYLPHGIVPLPTSAGIYGRTEITLSSAKLPLEFTSTIALAQAAEFFHLIIPTSLRAHAWISIRWEAPPRYYFKLNTDASSRGNLGLQLALDLGIHNIIIQIDSMIAANTTSTSQITNSHPWSNIVGICRDLRKRFERFEPWHVFREGNQLADALAKKAGDMHEDLVVLDFVLSNVNLIYLADIMGVAHPRLL
ncbi:hypothetical protein L6164_037735 [Bauhinia variegata]|uniref:Uncharacterized protein n=1 Tax=Bauhinia variegata TaxID=167791 RepID=A0ACB9KL99_BAUVA|nr:hypothetical protein L6164_037735 [Bauhinia variegata]